MIVGVVDEQLMAKVSPTLLDRLQRFEASYPIKTDPNSSFGFNKAVVHFYDELHRLDRALYDDLKAFEWGHIQELSWNRR